MKRFWVVVMALAVLTTGCGGADGDASPAEGGAAGTVDLSVVVDVETASVIDGFVEALGTEDAFRGVLFAFDNGYDVEQVTAGMGDGSLDANGVIAGVVPSGAMVGLIDRSGPSAHGAIVLAAGPVIVAGASPVTAEEFKRGILDEAASMFLGVDLAAERERRELSEEASRALIATTVALIGAGYTMEQVIEFVVFGERAMEGQFDVNAPRCWVVLGADKLVVFPENEALVGDCAATYEGLRDLEVRLGRRATTTTVAAVPAATTGSITGVVIDVTAGVGVAGATVTVTPGGVAVTTDADGVFTFGDIEPGTSTLTVTAEGFPGAAAEVTVVAGEVSDTTIGLDRTDDLPWTYEGTARGVLTAANPFRSGAPFVIESTVQVRITLNADGTAVFEREFPETKESLVVDCADRKAYVSSGPGLPPTTTVGTHADGEFEVPMGDVVVTGTYSPTEIQGHWGYEILTAWCDRSITGKLWDPDFSFGPESMERVYDTP